MLQRVWAEFDFFAAPPTLRARGEPETTNSCGAIFSILLFIAFFILFVIHLIQIFSLSSISVVTRDEQYDNGEGQLSNIMFGVGFRLFSVQVLAPYAIISAHLVSSKDSQINVTKIQLQPCELEQWSSLMENTETKFKQFQLDGKLCPAPNQNITLKNSYFHSEFDFLNIAINSCVGLPHCIEQDAGYMEDMEEFLNMYRYVETSLIILDTGFNPSKKNSTFVKITNVRSTFTMQRSTEVAIDVSKYRVETDVSLSPFSVIEEEQGYYLNNFFEGYYEKRQNHPDLTYNLFFSEQYKVIQRQFGKVDEVLSYVGGLFALVLSFFSFFMMSYNEYRYQIMVAEGAFNYNDEGKKLLAHDLSFFKYIKYSLFDWIRVLCCCQPDWQDCIQIQETRQEANHQLDVSLLFKKLQHFDRAIQYLITQREQICLYLTEPPSIKQVRKKRKYAEYYDKIIQGQSAMTIEDVKVNTNIQNILGYAMNLSSSDAKYRQNSRIREQADKSRQNILEVALEKHNEEDQEVKMDEQETEIEHVLAECFFHMKPENRRRIQQKIPIKILQRLQKKLNKMNSEAVFEINIRI